jgi:hypothetical protein
LQAPTERKLIVNPLKASAAHTLAERGIVYKLYDGLGQTMGVFLGQGISCLSIKDEFSGSPGIRGHYWEAHRHGF